MINKIDGPGSVRPPPSLRRASKSSKTGESSFSTHMEGTEETESASGVAVTSSLTNVAGLFGLQEVDDALARAAKGKLRAQDILDRLDEIRLEILDGTISAEKLAHLSRMVNARRPEISDPQLAELLDEIDLRAQIELAKFSRRSTDV